MNIIKPPALNQGDTIGILAPSGAVDEDTTPIMAAIDYFSKLGFKTLVSNDLYLKKRYLAGDDLIKVKNIHAFFENPKINAIICMRGGYGAIRLIDKIDYSIIRNNPKIFCGYSDITALNLMFLKRAGLMTYSGPMIMSDFGLVDRSEYTMNEFFKAVTEDKYSIFGETVIKQGEAEGLLWGGNLATVTSLCGIDFIPDEPFIFIAEDICEPVYKIDRMLRQLMNIEKFRQNVKGLCFGYFADTDNRDWLLELFKETSEELNIPCTREFKITHTSCKTTVPIGAKAKLNGLELFINKSI